VFEEGLEGTVRCRCPRGHGPQFGTLVCGVRSRWFCIGVGEIRGEVFVPECNLRFVEVLERVAAYIH
jgi:hypothetical protein